MPESLNISVVIPAHQDGPKLRECLESLKKADPKPLEIILVVDGDFDAKPYKDKGYVNRLVKTDPGSGPAREIQSFARLSWSKEASWRLPDQLG